MGDLSRWYSNSFAGTSSASPVVAGAVAQISSIAEAKGRTVTPEQMRAALVATGIEGVANQRIGTLPQVPRALAALGLSDAPVQVALANGGFEVGATGWTGNTAAISPMGLPASSGLFKASLGGYGRAATDVLNTTLTVPRSGGTLAWDERVVTKEAATNTYDRLRVQLVNASGTVVATLGSASNLDARPTYRTRTASLAAWAGQTLTLRITSAEDASTPTTFPVDNLRVTA